jgi:ABC-type Na+ transport system ATPase subunit NatA
VSPQELDQARTALDAAQAKLDALKKQVEAQRATVALARSNAEQVSCAAARCRPTSTCRRRRPRSAPRPTCGSRYTEIHAPIDGIVDVRAARVGEVVNAGQPIVTLINPDDLWVRADVEETYIDRVRIGDTLTGPPAVGRRARRARCSIAASTRRSPRSATSAAPSATSRRSSPAARRQPRSPARRRHDGVRAVACRVKGRQCRARRLPPTGAAMPHERHRRSQHRQEVRRLHRRQRHQLRRRGGRDLRPARPERRRQVDADPDADDAAAADAGTALVNGFDVVKQADGVRRSIGVIPQAMTSDLELSVEENLLIFAKLYGVPRAKRKKLIDELLAAVELTQWRDKQVKNLSGGMRRRVEIARGLVHEPRIFFLDEPTTGLDPVSRVAVWEMLQKIKSRARPHVLITTHYMDEADKLCDRIAIVDHGELKALDSPLKLKASIPARTRSR